MRKYILFLILSFLFSINALNLNKNSLYFKKIIKSSFNSRSESFMTDSVISSNIKKENLMTKIHKAVDVMYKFSRPHTIKVISREKI